jgi:hypothetical protein
MKTWAEGKDIETVPKRLLPLSSFSLIHLFTHYSLMSFSGRKPTEKGS